MVAQPEIQIVGASGEPPPEPPRWRWMLAAAAGVTAGLALGVVAMSGSQPTPTSTTAGAVPPPVPPATAAPITGGPRLAARVPGLLDSLVAVQVDPTGGLEVSVWRPTAQAPQPLEAGDVRQLDADRSRSWLSGLGPARLGGGVLWVGNEAGLEPLTVGAEAVVWHGFLPGRLAWVSRDGGRRLVIADLLAGNPPQVVTELGPSEVPVWWNQAGIVLRDEASRGLRLIGVEGSELSTHPPVPRFVGGGARLGIVVKDDGQTLLDETLRLSVPAPWELACGQPAFSPIVDDVVAIQCASRADRRQQLQVWKLASDEPRMLASFEEEGMLPPAWTPDGRFVVVPLGEAVQNSTEVVFLEVATGEVSRVRYPARVVDLETTLGRLTS